MTEFVSAVQPVLSTIESLIPWVVFTLLFLSLTPYLGRRYNWFELTSHFRLQYLLGSVFCVGLCLPLAKFGYMAAALAAAAINLSAIVPLYSGRPPRANTAGQRLRVVFANVLYTNTAYDRFIDWARQQVLDVLVVQEVDERWTNALQALAQDYPFSAIFPRDTGSGIALYSRIAFEQLPLEIPEGDLRPGILVKLNTENIPVHLLSVHPLTPILPSHFKHRNSTLAAAAAHLQRLSAPKIFVGDLNCSLWSPIFQDFERQTNLVNVRKGFGLLTSWPTFMGFRWLMMPIDHCLVSSGIRIVSVKTGGRTGSDHLPLIMDLEIE